MKSSLLVFGAAALLVLWQQNQGVEIAADELRLAPEFPSQDKNHWINSVPLKMTSTGDTGLRGKVVLLNVWTFM